MDSSRVPASDAKGVAKGSMSQPCGGSVAPLPASATSKYILLVEDNTNVAEITGQMLLQAGHQVRWVSDAATALDIMDAVDFDLMVADIVMRGSLDGLELARRIRMSRPSQPILLVTGYSESAEAAGVEFFVLRKPFKFSDLCDAIASTCAEAAASF